MGEYNFRKDLKVAKATEKEVAQIIISNPKFYSRYIENVSTVSFGTDKHWDFMLVDNINREACSFEVKEDFYSFKSGNVALEVESRGKDSGIITSKARYWVYKIYLQPDKEPLIVIVDSFKLNGYTHLEGILTKTGGDKGSNTILILVPVTELLAMADLIISPSYEEKLLATEEHQGNDKSSEDKQETPESM